MAAGDGERTESGRELTGRKVLVIVLAFFGTMLAANLALMYAALSTFPGLVVKNSYVASQEWNDKTAAQKSLGWRARIDYVPGELAVIMTGADGMPVPGLEVTAVVGRPGREDEDRRLVLEPSPLGYAAPLDLAPGRWRVELLATDGDGARFEARAEFIVRAEG